MEDGATVFEVEIAASEEAEDGAEGVPVELSTTEVLDAVPTIETSVDTSEAELALKVAALAERKALVEVGAELDDELRAFAGHVKSNKGVVDNVVPTKPKLGAGVFGYASCKVYHQVLIFPKMVHAV